MKRKINVKNIEIVLYKYGKEDYISLTDMAKFRSYDSGVVIANWLTTKYTIQFMGIWEQMNNPNFNLMEFHKIKNEVGTNGFIVSSSMWIKKTWRKNKDYKFSMKRPSIKCKRLWGIRESRD